MLITACSRRVACDTSRQAMSTSSPSSGRSMRHGCDNDQPGNGKSSGAEMASADPIAKRSTMVDPRTGVRQPPLALITGSSPAAVRRPDRRALCRCLSLDHGVAAATDPGTPARMMYDRLDRNHPDWRDPGVFRTGRTLMFVYPDIGSDVDVCHRPPRSGSKGRRSTSPICSFRAAPRAPTNRYRSRPERHMRSR